MLATRFYLHHHHFLGFIQFLQQFQPHFEIEILIDANLHYLLILLYFKNVLQFDSLNLFSLLVKVLENILYELVNQC